MPKPPGHKKTQKGKDASVSLADVELLPDAWPKFEVLIKSAAKIGHKPIKVGKNKKP